MPTAVTTPISASAGQSAAIAAAPADESGGRRDQERDVRDGIGRLRPERRVRALAIEIDRLRPIHGVSDFEWCGHAALALTKRRAMVPFRLRTGDGAGALGSGPARGYPGRTMDTSPLTVIAIVVVVIVYVMLVDRDAPGHAAANSGTDRRGVAA